ncbi:MAG TPA: VIT1/CCC1 transporter family protein [Candidatus Saccharimonadales bacterium]|nr:VIT1/CCC1 transporter family protein [Candidatus Saccharimonadales bacterium]
MSNLLNPFSWPVKLGGQRPRTEDEYNKFILQTVQPGLAGLMDGSVSTLAPIFAVAFATHKPHFAFVTGVAAAVGAGISMAFAEALSDTGELTGRGRPLRRGIIIGLMTFLGGIFHTLPFLFSNIHHALIAAYIVVGVELIAIAYIRYRYFSMKMWISALQVIVGGGLVFVAGILIGAS